MKSTMSTKFLAHLIFNNFYFFLKIFRNFFCKLFFLIIFIKNFAKNSPQILVKNWQIFVKIPRDENAEKCSRDAEICELENKIKILQSRLKNKNYAEKAPPKLVAETRENLRIAEKKLENLRKIKNI